MPLEPPALNPTAGVKGRPPVMLDYRKDPTRPGGGVFVAQDSGTSDALKDLPRGVIISAGEVEEDADAAGSVDGDSHDQQGQVAQRQQQQQQAQQQMDGSGAQLMNAQSGPSSATPMVNLTPLSGGRGSQYSNVNPAMNLQASQSGSANVQVMNILDGSQSSTAMADLAMADNGFLDGIPGGMFDWGTSCSLFDWGEVSGANAIYSCYAGQWDTFFSRFSSQSANAAGSMSAFAQHQQQQQQQQMQQMQAQQKGGQQ